MRFGVETDCLFMATSSAGAVSNITFFHLRIERRIATCLALVGWYAQFPCPARPGDVTVSGSIWRKCPNFRHISLGDIYLVLDDGLEFVALVRQDIDGMAQTHVLVVQFFDEIHQVVVARKLVGVRDHFLIPTRSDGGSVNSVPIWRHR